MFHKMATPTRRTSRPEENNLEERIALMKKVFKDKQDFIVQYRAICREKYGRHFEDCNDFERYSAMAELVANKANAIKSDTPQDSKKTVYYFSLEFLIGPLLDNYLLNLGIRDMVADGCEELGTSLDSLIAQEVDPGLGNGGLGRLAACFLDSMAAEGMAGYGNGMRYHYGFFKQEIEGGRQVEKPDNWLAKGFPWETRRDDSVVIVQFGGEVVRHEDFSHFWFTQEGGEKIRAVPYDVPIVGYGGETVNHLRLWSAEPYEEKFDLEAFNAGNYEKASKFRTDVEAITTILYPADAGEHGKLLRLKQEYLFVCAGLQTILRSYEKKMARNPSLTWEDLPDHVAIQTNDTHPALCGPELMRMLVDEHGLSFDKAFEVTRKTISYTNHTILPEALERWPIDTLRALIPRTYMFIDEVNRLYCENFSHERDDWYSLLQQTAILWDGEARMANMSVIFSHSVNGVSALHTDIIKENTLRAFNILTPEKFNNKTNGVSHRRFLANANPPYAKLITDAIGDGWLKDAFELSKLRPFSEDNAFLEGFDDAKRLDKERLARYIKDQTGIALDTNMVFDVQVKRFHAYKRQLLNVFKILDLYNRILTDPSFKPVPTAFIISGKAAQSYVFAKEVIRLINAVADVINNDPKANDLIKVAFIPNFSVSNAQLIYSAADISEQISWAGSEASGTSNMKLMMNGAITLGTDDGANIEIRQLVGDDNIKIFGLSSAEVDKLRADGQYWARKLIDDDPNGLGKIVGMLIDGSLSRQSGNFESIHDGLMQGNDYDLVLKDFHSYTKAWEDLTNVYATDRIAWNRSGVINTAMSGYFSSDRTIREYDADIWHTGIAATKE